MHPGVSACGFGTRPGTPPCHPFRPASYGKPALSAADARPGQALINRLAKQADEPFSKPQTMLTASCAEADQRSTAIAKREVCAAVGGQRSCALTLTRYWDRRRFIRVPAEGPARWTSGPYTGFGELLDISPGGAGLRVSAVKSAHVGARLSLDIPLASGTVWRVATHAKVVCKRPEADGSYRVGLEFERLEQPGRESGACSADEQ